MMRPGRTGSGWCVRGHKAGRFGFGGLLGVPVEPKKCFLSGQSRLSEFEFSPQCEDVLVDLDRYSARFYDLEASFQAQEVVITNQLELHGYRPSRGIMLAPDGSKSTLQWYGSHFLMMPRKADNTILMSPKPWTVQPISASRALVAESDWPEYQDTTAEAWDQGCLPESSCLAEWGQRRQVLCNRRWIIGCNAEGSLLYMRRVVGGSPVGADVQVEGRNLMCRVIQFTPLGDDVVMLREPGYEQHNVVMEFVDLGESFNKKELVVLFKIECGRKWPLVTKGITWLPDGSPCILKYQAC
ncbi:hypothetical protein Pelo_17420 [Pelomyxa schiedti]|nr:hypothetical protein Pelo_17420 [Pelomyxa schiedti]